MQEQEPLPVMTVSAAEFQRHFGRYQDEALKQPFAITRNGRDRLVFRTEDLTEGEVEAITHGGMDPRHVHLNAELD